MRQLPGNGTGVIDYAAAAAARRDRYRTGKALRLRVPRERHAACPAPWERDAVALLRETDRARIHALLPRRYERMAESAFGFLRGAAAVMAHDLAGLPAAGLPVLACGDCHVKNFGAFTSPEGQILFDLNDFDESLSGVDFTVDLKRLAASVAVLARDRNLPEARVRKLAAASARAYRDFMHELGAQHPAQVWQTIMEIHHEVGKIDDDKVRAVMTSILEKTEKRLAADHNFPEFAILNGRAWIVDHKDRIEHLALDFELDSHALFARYPQSLLPERRRLLDRYSLRDTAFKIVGIGSLGTYCAIGLFLSADAEPLFLQIKEGRQSVYAKDGVTNPDPAHRGRAIVEGQRALQAASDVFLGWTDDERTGRHFYVRHLKERRLDDIFDDVLDAVGAKHETAAIASLAMLCGRTLARAHARTADAATLAGYMGKSDVLDEAIASFAMAYADNTYYDRSRLVAAIDPVSGLLTR